MIGWLAVTVYLVGLVTASVPITAYMRRQGGILDGEDSTMLIFGVVLWPFVVIGWLWWRGLKSYEDWYSTKHREGSDAGTQSG